MSHNTMPAAGPCEGRRTPLMLLPLALGAALLLPACSFGISSIKPEAADATGSLPKLEIVKASTGQEDARRAHGALGVALDPQGSGTPVSWDNPDTKTRGVIAPRGQPFVKADEICRDFKATVVKGPSTTARDGTACRTSGDQWEIRYLAFPRPVT